LFSHIVETEFTGVYILEENMKRGKRKGGKVRQKREEMGKMRGKLKLEW
jgi:hypothetical protein